MIMILIEYLGIQSFAFEMAKTQLDESPRVKETDLKIVIVSGGGRFRDRTSGTVSLPSWLLLPLNAQHCHLHCHHKTQQP